MMLDKATLYDISRSVMCSALMTLEKLLLARSATCR